MAGASAAASARQRRSKQISKKDSIEIDSTYNRSDERLHAISSLFGQSDNDIDGSLRSLTPNRRSLLSKTKSRRDVTKIPTPRDDNDQHNNSSFVSCAIELNEANEGIEMNSPHAKEDESFNENDDASNANSSKLPSWFICINNGRKYIGKRVNDPRVQTFILVLILINSLMMGIATFPFVKDNPETSEKFDIADQIFLVIFTVESGLQLLYYGWYLFTDSFLVFDLLIVIMSWALEGTQVIRAFRIFRALRLITRVEVMRNLVMALFDVIPKMTAIAMLLTLIFFIFGVMMTQLFKDMYPQTLSQPYFESLWNTLFTLFQMMTLDEWADILAQVQEVYPWAWAPFIIFIVITGFVVVNLIIAVICDAVHVLGNENKAGLYGYDSDSLQSKTDRPDHPLDQVQAAPSSQSTATQRLEELQQQLDEMVKTQDQMRRTIEVLSSRLTFSLNTNGGEVSRCEGDDDS